jgi:two-component system sensor histidine kinase KdpD
VAHVETPSTLRASQADRDRLWQTLRLAESLGGETAVLAGENFAREAVRYARERNASRILVGKPTHPRWQDWFGRSRLEELVRASGGIDVTIVADDDEAEALGAATPRPRRDKVSWRHLATAAAIVGVETAICFPLYARLRETNLVMLFLLGLALVSVHFGRRVSIFAALLSVASFDFFFVEPRFTFAVADTEYVISLGVLLAVGLTISTLAARVERQLEAAHDRERRTAALYALASDLAAARDLDELLTAAATRIKDVFLSQVIILLPTAEGGLEVRGKDSVTYRLDAREDPIARWVFANGKVAGMSTDTLPAAKGIYLPLRTARGMLGVVGLHPAAPQQFSAPEEMHFLTAYANQLALAIERRTASPTSPPSAPSTASP